MKGIKKISTSPLDAVLEQKLKNTDVSHKKKAVHNVSVTSEELTELMKLREALEREKGTLEKRKDLMNSSSSSPNSITKRSKSPSSAKKNASFSSYQHLVSGNGLASTSPTTVLWHKSLRS